MEKTRTPRKAKKEQKLMFEKFEKLHKTYNESSKEKNTTTDSLVGILIKVKAMIEERA